MKKHFNAPSFEVVRFDTKGIIATSICYCDIGGYDYGMGEDECVGKNNPACTCSLVTPINCVD